MIITNARKITEEDWEFDIKANTDEVEYLVNLAVGVLILNGQIALQEQEDPQELSVVEDSANETNRNLN